MEFIQHDWNWAWATLAAVSGTLLLVTSLRGGGRGVSPAQATQLINREDAIVVDVRESGEYAAGHIPDARHIPLGDLAKRAGELAGVLLPDGTLAVLHFGDVALRRVRRFRKGALRHAALHSLSGKNHPRKIRFSLREGVPP